MNLMGGRGADLRKLSKYRLYGVIEPLTYIANHRQCFLALLESAMTIRIALKISLCHEKNKFAKYISRKISAADIAYDFTCQIRIYSSSTVLFNQYYTLPTLLITLLFSDGYAPNIYD